MRPFGAAGSWRHREYTTTGRPCASGPASASKGTARTGTGRRSRTPSCQCMSDHVPAPGSGALKTTSPPYAVRPAALGAGASTVSSARAAGASTSGSSAVRASRRISRLNGTRPEKLRGLVEPVPLRPERGGGAVGDADGFEHARLVRLDRLLGDPELAGDLLV